MSKSEFWAFIELLYHHFHSNRTITGLVRLELTKLLTNSMMVIQHRCNTIKSEAIKAIIFDPHSQIGKKESQNFPAKKKNKTENFRNCESNWSSL